MPNHVENVIYLEGPEEQIQALLEKVKYDEIGVGSLDFQKVIPMPDSLNIESGSRTTHGLEAYEDFWKVYTMAGTVERDPLEVPMEKEEVFLRTRTDIRREEWELGRNAFQNQVRFGYPTWYEWCWNAWGTKWNSYGYEERFPPNGGNKLVFQTAWEAPHPVIEKMAQMFPAVRITHNWADENIGHNCGRIEYENGKACDSYCPVTEEEAVSFACGVWDYDEEEYLPEPEEPEPESSYKIQIKGMGRQVIAETIASVILAMEERGMKDRIPELSRRLNEAKDMEAAFSVLQDYVSFPDREVPQMEGPEL